MKLKTQLVILSLSIGLIVILAFDIIFYHSVKETIITQVCNQMESVSELKENRIERWIANNSERLSMVLSQPELAQYVNNYLTSKDDFIRAEIIEILQSAKFGSLTIRTVSIATPDGNIFASNESTLIGINFSHNSGFKKSLKGRQSIDDLHFMDNAQLGVYLTAPLKYKNKIIAVLIIDNNGEELIQTVQDYTGLGATGETTLSKRLPGGEAIFLTPLRFDSSAALVRTIPNDTNLPDVMALFKREGLFKNVLDYRNKKVIAVTRFIPATGWGIVTKIDQEEALTPINKTRTMVIFISLGLGVCVLLITWVFGNYLTDPLYALIGFAHRLKGGNYNERIKTTSKNEIGILGTAFNELAGRLETSKSEIDKTLAQLKQSNEALNNFAYTITHDLRSPLSTIEGLINILHGEEIKEKEKSYEHILELIRQKVIYMGEMVAKVLEYAKTGSSANIEKVSIDTNLIVKEVISMINPGDNFQFVIESKLPTLVYPKVPLIQVFQNIIANSVKYMDKPKGVISIGCEDKGRYWQFYISDNGIGIEEKDYDKIFLMLKKITRGSMESTGIGLATVKKIINENGGDVWVHSKLKEGSTFYFTIPKI